MTRAAATPPELAARDVTGVVQNMSDASDRHRTWGKMGDTEKGCGFPQPRFTTPLLLSRSPEDQNR